MSIHFKKSNSSNKSQSSNSPGKTQPGCSSGKTQPKPSHQERLELVIQDKNINPADIASSPLFKERFKRYLPVVIDVETGGVDWNRDALLEVAVVILQYDEQKQLVRQLSETVHLQPYPGGRLTDEAMAIHGIDPDHPFRFAMAEADALEHIFTPIRQALKNSGCARAALVGHNSHFDLHFIQAAINRTKVVSPLHRFTSYDTATLAGAVYGETVLAKALSAANITFDPKQAHSALYDAEKTADLFCHIINHLHQSCINLRS